MTLRLYSDKAGAQCVTFISVNDSTSATVYCYFQTDLFTLTEMIRISLQLMAGLVLCIRQLISQSYKHIGVFDRLPTEIEVNLG